MVRIIIFDNCVLKLIVITPEILNGLIFILSGSRRDILEKVELWIRFQMLLKVLHLNFARNNRLLCHKPLIFLIVHKI